MKSRPNIVWFVSGFGASAILVAALLWVGVAHLVSGASPAATPTPNIYDEGVALGGVPAPGFSLQDQHGDAVSLAQFRGHPIVLTFFDSLCPHADCSLMAEYINWTAQDMGAGSSKVAWVALSVNPWHDTQATATSFLSTRQVTIPLHYALGSFSQLQPIWDAYHMQVCPPDTSTGPIPAGCPQQPNGIVTHSTGVYVIDAQGREQMFLDEGFSPQALASYLTKMVKNGGSAVSGSPGQGATAGATLVTRQVNGYWVIFTAQPGQYGTYNFTVTVEDGQHTPVQGAHVGLDLSMTTMAMGVVHADLSPATQGTPGSYQAPGVVSMLGPWQAKATITIPGQAKPLTTTFDFTAKFQ